MTNWLVSILLVAGALCGCGGEDCSRPGAQCISAQFVFDDGASFHFAHPAITSHSTTMWGVEATDASTRYAVVIMWAQDTVKQPGEYGANLGLTKLGIWLGRPSPTDATKMRLSSCSGGKVVFERIGYAAGELVNGTFSGARLDRNDADDKIHLQLDEGAFAGRIP